MAPLALFAAPFLILHILTWFFTSNERPLLNVRTRYDKQPDGSPLAVFYRYIDHARVTIIFVHGTPATGTAFRHQMDYPFPEANLVTYDRPGFGRSSGSDKKANLGYQSSVLIKLIGEVPTEKVILVGHSYGGPIVLQTAALLPNRVAGVVMIGGSVSPAEEHPWAIQYFGALPLIRSLLPRAVRASNLELINLKADLLALDKQLPSVQCPVFMLQGNKDTLVPDRNVSYLKERFDDLSKSSQLSAKLFPTFNHFMMWEQPDDTNREIAKFLERDRS